MKRYDKTIRGFSASVRRRLLAYDWPGNVRQLRNAVESMVVVDIDGLIDEDDLPEYVLTATLADVFPDSNRTDEDDFDNDPPHSDVKGKNETPEGVIVSPSPEKEKSLKPFVGLTLETLTRLFIQETLRSTGGNREETAKILGVGERTLYRRLKEFSQENEKGVQHDK